MDEYAITLDRWYRTSPNPNMSELKIPDENDDEKEQGEQGMWLGKFLKILVRLPALQIQKFREIL